MSLAVEITYAQRIGMYLSLFDIERRQPFVAIMRCPICGDSQRYKNKRRGYIYERSGKLFYKCHNCGTSTTFRRFLKIVNPALWDEFLLDIIRANGQLGNEAEQRIATAQYDRPRALLEVSSEPEVDPAFAYMLPLSSDPRALAYVQKRRIPEPMQQYIRVVKDFPTFANTLLNKHIAEPPHARIVIPVFEPLPPHGFIGVCARLFYPDRRLKRYYTLLNEHSLKLWLPAKLDTARTVWVTEGIIDAMFIPNAAAMLGASATLPAVAKLLPDFVIVRDNEPRNEQIVNMMLKDIVAGYKVIVWPRDFVYKDINEMILHNVNIDLPAHTYSGAAALVAVHDWSKLGDNDGQRYKGFSRSNT